MVYDPVNGCVRNWDREMPEFPVVFAGAPEQVKLDPAPPKLHCRHLLAFSGRKQSGKDTLGTFLKRNIKELTGIGEAEVVGFADALKSQVSDLFGILKEKLYGTDEDKNSLTSIKWCDFPGYEEILRKYSFPLSKEDTFLTVRELLQVYGTDIIRKIDPHAWVRAAVASFRRKVTGVLIVTDCRFQNELDALHTLGGKVIRLTRNQSKPAVHESETALDNCKEFDAVIDNANMTPAEQRWELVAMLDKWGWLSSTLLKLT